MTTLDTGITILRSAAGRVSAAHSLMGRRFKSVMPTGLYARTLLIIVTPMVLLQSVVAFVFMERHWNTVTQRLSASVVQDISALIEFYPLLPAADAQRRIRRVAQEHLNLVVDFLPVTEMPPPAPKPFFSLLDQALSEELRKQIGKPFWIDTVGRSSLVEIRVQLDDTVLRVFARRNAAYASNSEIFLFWMVGTSFVLLTVAILFLRKQIGKPFWIDTVGRSSLVEIRVQLDDTVLRVFARRNAAYASNSEIFLFWMVGTSLVLLTVAILFLRNQIKPILRLADAAESFGKGREVPDFRPRGAREVRRAAQAFVEMKQRVERTMEQRTTMLAGVSHDLRTILTRFKLEMALLGDSPEVDAMKKDIDEMALMLEAYLAFARGDSAEPSAPTDMAAFLQELKLDAERQGDKATVVFHGEPVVTVRPAAFKRCLANLVSNAARYASSISITGHRDHLWLTVTIDDDGPGIPPGMREEVFKPFLRLDHARNQDEGGTGLGLAIARDIARSHGGDITLGNSPLGGLRATVRIPV